MSAVHVEHITEEEALARRAEIIALVGDVDGFRQRAEAGLLSPEELRLYDELDGLDYLLRL